MRHTVARNQTLTLLSPADRPRCSHCAWLSYYLGELDYFIGQRLKGQKRPLCAVHAFEFARRHGLPVPDGAMEMERAA
jgi:hypothetical protein